MHPPFILKASTTLWANPSEEWVRLQNRQPLLGCQESWPVLDQLSSIVCPTHGFPIPDDFRKVRAGVFLWASWMYPADQVVLSQVSAEQLAALAFF